MFRTSCQTRKFWSVELLKLRDKLEEKLLFVTAPLGTLTKTAKAINEHGIIFFFNENI